MFPVLELLVRFLERFATEEHLPGEQQRDYENWNGEEASASNEDLRKNDAKDSKPQVADDELAPASDAELLQHTQWVHPIVDARRYRYKYVTNKIVHHRCKTRRTKENNWFRRPNLSKRVEDGASASDRERNLAPIEESAQDVDFSSHLTWVACREESY
jgi:hypothetical protein